ncbi:MAG: LPS export ABC transporter periplasmic protein LptC [Rhodospirillales bacterium]|nr:LPS export ABC transporter periplasmic protein LptC [Rhodospirillales bacterium]
MAADPLREEEVPPPPRPVAAAVSARDDGTARALRLAVLAPDGPRKHSALYSQIVGFLKFLLPAVALGIATLVLLWPQFNPLDQRFRLAPVQVSIEDLENLRMVQPRYVGVDERNQPYSIVANQATQAKGSSDSTDLTGPQGDLTTQQGTWLALTADRGLYHQPEKTLDLWGGVSLFHDGGYEIATERARIDLGRGSAEGDVPIRGQGPNSVLTGQGFRILDRGARIEVRGQSRVVLFPAPQAQAQAQPQAQAAAPQTAQQPVPPPPAMGPRK